MSEIENRDNYILLPNSDSHNCFGCSPVNPSGLQMKIYTNQKTDLVVSWLSVPGDFSGWANFAHGGIISTILDEVMGWGGLVILRKLVVSKSTTVDYLKPVFIGSEIRAEGSVLRVNSEREGVMQGCIYNDNGEICAKSSSIVSLFTIEALRKLGAADEKMLSGIEQVINASNEICKSQQ
jgi:uncharacterized protein (TIGR00369 family)